MPVIAVADRVQQRRRGAALEDAIVAAAYDELSVVGYSAFTVEGVAARAKTGKASIYRRWPTKQLLVLDALLLQLPTPADCGIAPEMPDDMSTADALRNVAQRHGRRDDQPSRADAQRSRCEAAGRSRVGARDRRTLPGSAARGDAWACSRVGRTR